VVSRRQLLSIGLGNDAVGYRLRTGRLHRIHPGVYAVGHSLLQPYGRYMAAVLACGLNGFASHRTAGAILGLCPAPTRDLEVTVAPRPATLK